MIGWTPPRSHLDLGSVLVPDQLAHDGLSPVNYLGLLAKRIDRLVADVPPAEARALLQVVQENEPGVNLPEDLGRVGEVLSQTSNWLLERSGAPNRLVPGPLVPDQDAVLSIKESTLEEYLSMLYSDRAT